MKGHPKSYPSWQMLVFTSIGVTLVAAVMWLIPDASTNIGVELETTPTKSVTKDTYISVGDWVVATNYSNQDSDGKYVEPSEPSKFICPNGSPPKKAAVKVTRISKSGDGFEIEGYPLYLNNKIATWSSTIFRHVDDVEGIFAPNQ